MVLPANKTAPLEIDDFRDKTTSDPNLRWEKWRVQYKLPMLAKENIILDTLLGPKLEMVELSLESIYKEMIIGSSAQSERERKPETRNKDELAKQLRKTHRSRKIVFR